MLLDGLGTIVPYPSTASILEQVCSSTTSCTLPRQRTDACYVAAVRYRHVVAVVYCSMQLALLPVRTVRRGRTVRTGTAALSVLDGSMHSELCMLSSSTDSAAVNSNQCRSMS